MSPFSCTRTNASCTAALSRASMVKHSRDQSTDDPMRRSCVVMRLPYLTGTQDYEGKGNRQEVGGALVLPSPHALHEFLATKSVLGELLILPQLLLHHALMGGKLHKGGAQSR